MKFIIQLLFVCSVLSYLSCETDDEGKTLIQQQGKEYYPLRIDQESIYEIDSILYNDFTGRVDTVYLQRRELVESEYVDQQMRNAFVVGIYERSTDSSEWIKRKVVIKTGTKHGIKTTDNNLVEVALVFPVAKDKKWDVNAFNTEDEQEYVYSEVNRAYQLEGVSYDSTLLVSQEDEENLIERRFAEERYATNRGLIERIAIELETELNGDIRSGYEAHTRLISFR